MMREVLRGEIKARGGADEGRGLFEKRGWSVWRQIESDFIVIVQAQATAIFIESHGCYVCKGVVRVHSSMKSFLQTWKVSTHTLFVCIVVWTHYVSHFFGFRKSF